MNALPAPHFIDRLFLWARSKPFFHRFSWFTRILLFAGFFPTGLIKLLNQRFTIMGPETSIGAFFEAMYQTGLFWQFIGLAQVAAAVLLLFPRTAHLGAALFFPVILNIFIITVSIGFKGTWLITTLMLLAVTWLVFYDWHRFRSIFHLQQPAELQQLPQHRLDSWELAGFGIFAFSLFAFFMGTRFPVRWAWGYLPILGFAGGLLALGRFIKTKGRLPEPEAS